MKQYETKYNFDLEYDNKEEGEILSNYFLNEDGGDTNGFVWGD